jgi:FixJ family two-component response regulator
MSHSGRAICIVEDDVSTGTALRRLVGSLGYEAQVYNTATDFLASDIAGDVFCVLLDVNLPDLNGLDVQKRLRESGNNAPVVFLTGVGDVPMSVDAMRHGAVDFLLKPVDEKDLVSALRRAHGQHRQNAVADAERTRAAEKIACLTAREADVLRCVLTGAMNKQIAAHLGIAEKTVKVHRGRVMQKLGAGSIVDLMEIAALSGIEADPSLKR